MDTIYHYTSLKGFNGILNSNSVWLSNSMKTNDYKEIKCIIDVLHSLFPEENFLIHKFDELYNKWINSFFRPHICCFSYRGDQLSQWRSYADDGQGISIGFNKNYFSAIKDLDDNRDFIIEDVVYGFGQQKDMLKELINSKIKLIDILETPSNSFTAIVVASAILGLGMKFKHYSFSEENEVRLIHGHGKVAAEPDIFEYRFTNNDIISYVEIPTNLSLDNVFPINEIIIGPKCKVSIEEIKSFLLYKNYNPLNVKVKKSVATYR